jgi:hypothetical protein
MRKRQNADGDHEQSPELTAGGICLIGTLQGDTCMLLEPTANGSDGFEGTETVMPIRR